MEINITRFVKDACPRDYQASVAEIGQDAGKVTWTAACEDSPEYMFVNDENRDEIRRHFRTYGAWTDDEINAWTDIQLNAVLIQDISGELREFQELANSNWQEWKELCERGTCSGQLFGGELAVNGETYFYVGE